MLWPYSAPTLGRLERLASTLVWRNQSKFARRVLQLHRPCVGQCNRPRQGGERRHINIARRPPNPAPAQRSCVATPVLRPIVRTAWRSASKWQAQILNKHFCPVAVGLPMLAFCLEPRGVRHDRRGHRAILKKREEGSYIAAGDRSRRSGHATWRWGEVSTLRSGDTGAVRGRGLCLCVGDRAEGRLRAGVRPALGEKPARTALTLNNTTRVPRRPPVNCRGRRRRTTRWCGGR